MTQIETHIDPICGMTVDPAKAAGSFEYEGKTYYFCSTHCLHRFREEKSATPPVKIEVTKPGQKYTCPMHPEIIRDGPGSCPICGMALEPLTISLEDEENPELVDMTRRLWISLVLPIPVLAIG